MLMFPFEAESIAYIVCNHFGLDTSEYSFTYIASWCESKDMKALRASMDTIRKTSAEVIGNIETQIHELEMERPIEDASLENIEETAMQYAHRLIEAAEDASRGNFTDSQRNLIVNFAYKMDDKDEVLGLVNRMMTAIRRPGSEYTRSLMNETQAQIDNFPDGMIGFTEMHEAGIRLEHMYPLEKNRAVELYREGAEVFLLHGNPDNPEQAGQILAETENAILGHDGIFGITETEWEVHKEREAAIARQEKLEQDSAEKIDETLLLHGESGRFAIYQMDTGGEHTYQFMGFESAQKLGYSIDGKDYRMVYAAPWTPTITLDDIFERFNINRPNDFHGHSLSVSDVIVINRTAETKAYYVDSFGFEELPDFVQQRMEILENNHTRAYPPVYKGTLAQAMEERDVDAYLDSRKLNIDCKKAIEEAIALKFDGLHLEEDAATQVLEQFGEERMTFVMANTLRELSYDGRFSRQNKDWAEHIEIPENINQGKNLNQDYVIESHPAVLDGFIDMVRVEIRMQKIEQALDETEVTITADTRGFEADGHEGTWHTVDEKEYAEEKFFFMEHDEYGSDVAGIIVSEHGQLVAEDLWNGYDAGALEAISEYLQEKGISGEGFMPKMEPDELAYKIDDKYFAIQKTEEGYDYTFYALDYDELDGGAYDNLDISMRQAIEDILENEDMSLENVVPVDYEDLMAEVEEADERQMQSMQLQKESQEKQNQIKATITFYVAECMEFPNMGEYHNNLTLEEAIKIYESIPAERLHGIKGIGFDLQDGDEDYSGEYELMSGDRVDRELIDMIPHYKESPLVQKAINDMEKYLNEKHGKVQEAEQTVKVKQEVSEALVKKEAVSVEANQTQKKEPVKNEKGELKKSVLQSLKEFQTREKAQEQKNKEAEKSKAHRKGVVEL